MSHTIRIALICLTEVINHTFVKHSKDHLHLPQILLVLVTSQPQFLNLFLGQNIQVQVFKTRSSEQTIYFNVMNKTIVSKSCAHAYQSPINYPLSTSQVRWSYANLQHSDQTEETIKITLHKCLQLWHQQQDILKLKAQTES